MAYLYEAYKLEQACTISKMAYLYEAYKLEQACSNSKKTLKLVLVYKIHKI